MRVVLGRKRKLLLVRDDSLALVTRERDQAFGGR